MQTALTTSITSRDPKGLKYMQSCEAAYNKACLDEDQAQQLNENSEFTKGLVVLIDKHSQVYNRFELVEMFEVMVREGYNHDTRLDTFRKAHEQEFFFYNGGITDKNYAVKATTKLVSGRRFRVKAFKIKKRVSSEDCLEFLKTQKAVLVGAQGASLAYEQAKDKLPVGRWSVSFDEKDALPVVHGYRRVPCVSRDSDGDFKFNLGRFGDDWDGGDCLLCFCDLLISH